MAKKNTERNMTRLQTRLITTILKLSKHGLPVAAVWYQQGNVRFTGTRNMEEFFSKLDQKSLARAINEDIKNYKEP